MTGLMCGVRKGSIASILTWRQVALRPLTTYTPKPVTPGLLLARSTPKPQIMKLNSPILATLQQERHSMGSHNHPSVYYLAKVPISYPIKANLWA